MNRSVEISAGRFFVEYSLEYSSRAAEPLLAKSPTLRTLPGWSGLTRLESQNFCPREWFG